MRRVLDDVIGAYLVVGAQIAIKSVIWFLLVRVVYFYGRSLLIQFLSSTEIVQISYRSGVRSI